MTAHWKGAHAGNFSRGRAGHRPEAIVIHIMDGSLTGTDAWFNDPRSHVSAHYGVGKAGQVHQYVKETDSAHHAGTIVRPTWPLLKQRTNPNFYTLGIEHEGFGGRGQSWPVQMMQASLTLVRDLAERWAIPLDDRHIIPHRAIRASKPHCPGIDMAAYIAALNNTAPSAAGGTAGSRVAMTVRLLRAAHVRRAPRTDNLPLHTLVQGDEFSATSKLRGESVNGNDLWFANGGGEHIWAGNTDRPMG